MTPPGPAAYRHQSCGTVTPFPESARDHWQAAPFGPAVLPCHGCRERVAVAELTDAATDEPLSFWLGQLRSESPPVMLWMHRLTSVPALAALGAAGIGSYAGNASGWLLGGLAGAVAGWLGRVPARRRVDPDWPPLPPPPDQGEGPDPLTR